jgi:hypothetical protein
MSFLKAWRTRTSSNGGVSTHIARKREVEAPLFKSLIFESFWRVGIAAKSTCWMISTCPDRSAATAVVFSAIV